ncbi:MAG: conjugal transfer protein TraF [Rickettsiaceae bacterium]|nr:conjugal transfer protein TraF [Rickettsiaceae bacterium]
MSQFFTNCAFAKNSFYDGLYRGWLWFEEKAKIVEEDKIGPRNMREPSEEEYKQARKEIEQFAADLEKLKYMMLRYPGNLEYIKRYKEKEAILLENAILLSQNYAMVNFLNPHLNDELKDPSNLYGRKIKNTVEQQMQKEELKSLAQKVELFLFFSESCPYCKVLEKHLAAFASDYGFKVTAVSADNSKSNYFQSQISPELVAKLDLKVMPTVIAVTNDSSVRFELVRGAVSVADLEEKSLLMAKRMRELEDDYKIREGKEWEWKETDQ